MSTSLAAILNRILAAGVTEAESPLRPGTREMRARCGRTLTSEWRERGIGPICIGKE